VASIAQPRSYCHLHVCQEVAAVGIKLARLVINDAPAKGDTTQQNTTYQHSTAPHSTAGAICLATPALNYVFIFCPHDHHY
jgi:hypothetical protein